jgi:hypothetical protein
MKRRGYVTMQAAKDKQARVGGRIITSQTSGEHYVVRQVLRDDDCEMVTIYGPRSVEEIPVIDCNGGDV